MTALRDWFRGLTGRERWLVTIAAAFAAAVVLVYGIVLPLGAAHDAAHMRHRVAVAQSADVLAGLAALDRVPRPGSGTPRPGAGAPLAEQVAALADAEGLVLQGNEARGNDVTAIVVPATTPAAALAWLDAMAARGIVAEALTITPAADGTVAVDATLRRAGA